MFAKKAGIGVIEFSVGMGPRLLHTKRGETMYSLKLIPFGGSCEMVGEDEDCDAENSFQKKSVWARIAVVVGGPLFNFISAYILGVILIACIGTNPAKVTAVASDYGAGAAGIEVGDTILSINGRSISQGWDISLYFLENPLDGDMVSVTYERNGEVFTTQLDPQYSAYRTGISYMADDTQATLSALTEGGAAELAGMQVGDQIVSVNGIEITTGVSLQEYFEENPMDGTKVVFGCLRDGEYYEVVLTPILYETYALGMTAIYYREKVGVFGTLVGGFQEVCYGVKTVLISLRMLFTGKASISDMSGPVGIVSVIGSTVSASKSAGAYYVFLNVVSIAILLSANLGVFNLLPIPALDGGRLVFLILEAIRRKPIPQEKEGAVHTIGFSLLMALMAFVLWQDIVRLLG